MQRLQTDGDGNITKRTSLWKESPTVNEQVEEILGQMTLEEKVDLVSGKNDVAGQPDLAKNAQSTIPALALTDGPAGVRIANPAVNDGKATALPAPIALAATWNPDLARRYGNILGAEMVATGHNVFLGPAVDIARTPVGGRTFESFGEDPLLQARMVVPEVQAIQAHPVQACLKHYIVNNQEYHRSTIDVQIDERTLHEIYLTPFAAAVDEGGVAAVMGSYNKINGTYACENHHTLTQILREELEFCGWVMSDYLANHSTVESATAGLEWELGMRMWGSQLLEAVRGGQLREEIVDEMVRRILRPTVGLGLIEHPLTLSPLPVQQHGQEARAIAEQGIVLLKNADNLLPLSRTNIRSIAVIGPDADNVSAAGGGSGCVQPTYTVSVLEGIQQRVGESVRVAYAPGVDPIGPGVLLPGWPAIPSPFFTPPEDAGGAQHGLRVEYWDNPNFAGEPCMVRLEPRAELNYGFFDMLPGLSVASPKLPVRPANLSSRISARWTGHLTVLVDGEYTFSLTSLGTARFILNGNLLIDTTGSSSDLVPGRAIGATTFHTATVSLTTDEPYAVTIEYAADTPGDWVFNEAQLRLGWQPPANVITPSIAEATTLAQQSDVAIVVVRTYESEEMDRPNLRLPNEQDRLIEAVAAVNPRTIVVLMTGGPVETESWQSSVPAILEAWYAGQEQGNAIARVLFGEVNPSGKLPLTFPRGEDQTPLTTPVQYPGVDGTVQYSEGIFVGYRGYDQLGIEPQYPFGYGLSYTSFEYSDLDILPNGDGYDVSFSVQNVGQMDGAEVAQVYLGPPSKAPVPLAPKALAGFARVQLKQKERRRIAVHIRVRELSYWSESDNDWVIAEGNRTVYVGASSRDIRLERSIRSGVGHNPKHS